MSELFTVVQIMTTHKFIDSASSRLEQFRPEIKALIGRHILENSIDVKQYLR